MNKDAFLLDSDAVIGLLNEEDKHHQQTKVISLIIEQKHIAVVVSTTTIAECITSLHRRHNRPDLAKIYLDSLTNPLLTIYPVDREIIRMAAKIYDPQRSKKHTFFDAINVAVAQKERIEVIFSFDDFYRSFGLKLAGDLD